MSYKPTFSFNRLAFVTVGVAGLPAPGVLAHASDVVLSHPIKLVTCFVAGCIANCDVARATILDGVRNLMAAGFLECSNHFKDAGAFARAKVEHADTVAGSVLAYRAL